GGGIAVIAVDRLSFTPHAAEHGVAQGPRRGGVAVVSGLADLGLMLALAVRVAEVLRAHVAVVAVDGRIEALTGRRVALVDRARVAIVAPRGADALAGRRIAPVDGARTAIVTVDLLPFTPPAAARRYALLPARAGVSVVALHDALPMLLALAVRVAEVLRAHVAVVAVDRRIQALTGRRVARVDRARVAIVASRRADALAGR